MVSPVLVPVLWAIAGVTLLSIALYFRLQRTGFELRRANLFLRFRFFESYFLVVSASLVGIIAVEFGYLALASEVISLFPDAVILLMIHAAAVIVYLRIFLLLREGREA